MGNEGQYLMMIIISADGGESGDDGLDGGGAVSRPGCSEGARQILEQQSQQKDARKVCARGLRESAL